MVRWVYINAIGGVTISALTLVAATYLLVSLWTQGRGKLRVRLLLGMVISDVLLGLAAIVPESIYLSDDIGLRTGSKGCNASAFIITTVLFTQHMWTLAIALATYLLLKHPLSGATSFMERHSWTAAPIIWAVSLIHSGLWWRFVGFSSSGNLCYYGPHPITSANGLDARDLVQFIPRALVFIVIVVLYSTLFQFLRRPDTIQLSSQFVSGGTQSEPPKGVQMTKMFKKLGGGNKDPKKSIINPEAPWEQMEFVQIGHGRTWGQSPVQTQLSFQPTASTNGILLNSRPPSPPHVDTPDSRPHFFDRASSVSTEGLTTPGPSQRPSETDTLVSPDSKGMDTPDIVPVMKKDLSPVFSIHSQFDKSLDLDDDDDVADESRRPSQTLKEFFQENQAPGLEEERRGSGSASNSKGVPISATAYFNRQASLLMLYFPLAYMVVFSMSLVRLIYGMVHKQPSPLLTLMSSWMVLSVGLIDGLVYGLAEFLVRRRVRRKMPDRMGS